MAVSPQWAESVAQQITRILQRDFAVGEIEFAMGRAKTYFPITFSKREGGEDDNGGQPLSHEWSELHADYYEHFNYVFSSVRI